jgi:hypothetical protein
MPWAFWSRTLNILTLGRKGETFCCRAFRCWLEGAFPGHLFWKLVCKLLDSLAMWYWGERVHCYNQYNFHLLNRANDIEDTIDT